jgi:CRISPR-associated protein Cas6
MQDFSTIDAVFTVTGQTLALDHAYALFSALTRLIPDFRERKSWSLHSIPGRQTGPGLMSLSGLSKLTIRAPAQDIPLLMPLVAQELDIQGHLIRVGVPRIVPLDPAEALWARIVTIKGFIEPAEFKSALMRQVSKLEKLDQDPERLAIEVTKRRVIRVKEKNIVGFEVSIGALEPSASLVLQQSGLGGRHHMGAGIFVPQSTRK